MPVWVLIMSFDPQQTCDEGERNHGKGKSHVQAVLTGRLPLNPDLQNFCDQILHNASEAIVLAINDRNSVHLDQIVGG